VPLGAINIPPALWVSWVFYPERQVTCGFMGIAGRAPLELASGVFFCVFAECFI
jgi:hypothetical protein